MPNITCLHTVTSQTSNTSNLLKVVCYSVVPSPYQRDLFQALSCLSEIDLSVYYWEASVSDSPWPPKALQSYEKILPGSHLTWGNSRFHFNWHLPSLSTADVVILNGYQNLTIQLILHQYATTVPCIFWGEKIVADAGGTKGWLQRLLVKGLNNCKAIVAIGSKAKSDYHYRFPHTPIFNIPYYCNIDSFSQLPTERPRNPITILFCGQMIQRKGVDLLLHAFHRLLTQGYNLRLLLVGREANLSSMLEPLPDSSKQHIEFAGFRSPEDLPHLFRRADIFVLPSRYDGWGVVVNQALGSGLPIICSDAVGAAHDLIEPNVNGYIFPTGNSEALINALSQLLDHPELIRTASQASAEKASLWSPEVGAARWLQVLKSVATT